MITRFQESLVPQVHRMTGRWEEMPDFPSLPQGESPPGAHPPRVCIATIDVAGPVRCGGMGTSLGALARALAEGGHDATLFFLQNRAESHTMQYWVSRYAETGIRLVPLPETDLTLYSWSTKFLQTSYRAYLWLREQQFDVIHFHDRLGLGYWSVVAKHQGLAFRDTTLVVHGKGPILWSRMTNFGYLNSIQQLELDFMERRCMEWADVVITPSQYAMRWMLAHGRQLPERRYVQANILSHTARRALGKEGASLASPQKVEEIVFFGRLETRKGLELFCDALDLLAQAEVPAFTVTFLGRESVVSGQPTRDYLKQRGGQWSFRWQIISDYDHAQAVEYLSRGGQLAVVPSSDETFGNTVLEAIGLGIPFLASNATAFPEVVAAEDHERVLFPLEAEALAERLAGALQKGMRPASAAVDPEVNEKAWVRWHESLPRCESSCAASDLAPLDPESAPLVSVCMPTYNRPDLLRQALESVEAQDYPNVEVVLVDDASTDPEALALLDEVSEKFQGRGWQLIRHEENEFAPAARNTAARHAHGEYLLFMDDDNCAKPHEISTFVRIAQRSGADILTCCIDKFRGLERPDPRRTQISRSLILGGPVAVGLFRNVFGDNNALVKREVYLALGGQTVVRGVTGEDRELFAKAVLRGYKLEVVPEALFYYRVMETGLDRASSRVLKRLRAARPFRDVVPEPLRDLLLLTQGVCLQSPSRTAPGLQVNYQILPGLHLVRVGLRNCLREGPRKLLSDVWRKARERVARKKK